VQFCVYVALGSYLMNLEPSLPTAALILGWSAWRWVCSCWGGPGESWALKLELLRLASNVPLVWLAPLVGLWPASAVGWVGLLVTACSAASGSTAAKPLHRLAS
jgi:hypothetical protein